MAVAITSNNSFFRVHGAHWNVLPGARVEGCHFVDVVDVAYDSDYEQRTENCINTNDTACVGGGFLINATHGGSFRGNRIIRTMVHMLYPLLAVYGDGKGSVSRNTIVWANMLQGGSPNLRGRVDAGLLAFNASEITMVGVGIESYGAGWFRDTLHVEGIGDTRLFGVGGRVDVDPAAPAHGLYHMGSQRTKFVDNSMGGGNASAPPLTLPAEVESMLQVGSPYRSEIDAAPVVVEVALIDGLIAASFNSINTTAPSMAIQRGIADYDMLRPSSTRAGRPWDAPLEYWESPIPDPDGKTGGDDTAMLQALLDGGAAPALLPAGVYRVTRALVINISRAHVGFVGAGALSTVIDAAAPDINIFEIACPPWPHQSFYTFSLAGLTLRGGYRGLSLECAGPDRYAGFSDLFISHVVFRGFADAGIYTHVTLDNNYIDHVDFVGNAIGYRQRGGSPPSKWPNCVLNVSALPYLDKTVFHRSRVVNNTVGFDLGACRADNLNAWIECLFVGNAAYAINMTANNRPMVVASRFENNAWGHEPGAGPNSVIAGSAPYVVGCAFDAGEQVRFRTSFSTFYKG